MRFRLIVFALWLLLTCCGFAQETRGGPDAIFYNGKVVTVDAAFHIQQAFAVQGENFIAVGTDAAIKPMAGKDTRMIDLEGATLIPGLTDNHDHLFNTCRFLQRGVDMIGVTSVAEMQSRLRKAVETAKPGQVAFTTLGWALQPAPTRKELDQVSAEVPIVLIGTRRGAAIYNSAALKLAGISKENPIPPECLSRWMPPASLPAQLRFSQPPCCSWRICFPE